MHHADDLGAESYSDDVFLAEELAAARERGDQEAVARIEHCLVVAQQVNPENDPRGSKAWQRAIALGKRPRERGHQPSPRVRMARPRGAGRPRASSSRSSARSGDSGSGSSEGDGEPPPPVAASERPPASDRLDLSLGIGSSGGPDSKAYAGLEP